jgi:hypothetical protein
MSHPAIDKLVNFAPEERALAERFMRPQGHAPEESMDNIQLMGFLSQVNAARTAGQPITRQVLVESGLLADESAHPATGVRIAS